MKAQAVQQLRGLLRSPSARPSPPHPPASARRPPNILTTRAPLRRRASGAETAEDHAALLASLREELAALEGADAVAEGVALQREALARALADVDEKPKEGAAADDAALRGRVEAALAAAGVLAGLVDAGALAAHYGARLVDGDEAQAAQRKKMDKAKVAGRPLLRFVPRGPRHTPRACDSTSYGCPMGMAAI